TPELAPLSLHDALPIWRRGVAVDRRAARPGAGRPAGGCPGGGGGAGGGPLRHAVAGPGRPPPAGERAAGPAARRRVVVRAGGPRSEEHTSELQSPYDLV